MNFATGNGADTGSNGWRAEESALSPSNGSVEECDNIATGLYILIGIASNMRSGFILLNSSEHVTYSNPNTKRLLGMSDDELLDQPVFDIRKRLLSLAADPETARTELDRIWLHPEQESSTDLALANTAVRWLRIQCFPVHDDPGHLLGRGVLLDDITQERSSNQVRDETLALAVHELKTPLAIIKGSATTLLGNSTRWDPVMQREMLQMIDTQADRLHDILNTLLDVWRLDAGAQDVRPISELLSELVERWQRNTPTPQQLPFSQAQSPTPAFTKPGGSITTPLVAPSTGPLRQSQRLKIFIAENDPRMARYLRANLEEQRYSVQAVGSGAQFLRQLDLEDPDIILLATHLADMSGIELLQRLREFTRTPVIMLCDPHDVDDEDERVRLLDLGADDLVLKPFGMKELLARMRVLARRLAALGNQATHEATFTTGDLIIDYAQHQVVVQGRPVQLSRTEYKLLSTLAQNVGRVLTHEMLLERVWGTEYNREVDFIWVYISRLRRKIEARPREPRYILTVPDVGYKLAKL